MTFSADADNGFGAASGVTLQTLEMSFEGGVSTDAIYSMVKNALRTELEFDRISIVIRRSDNLLERVYVDGLGVTGVDRGSPVISPGSPLPRSADGSLLINAPSEHILPGGTMAKLGLNSWAEVAIDGSDQPLGYLAIRSKRKNAYGEPELAVLKRASRLLAPALLLAPLAENYKQQSLIHGAVSRISTQAESMDSTENVYGLVCEELNQIACHDRFVISRYNQSERNLIVEFVRGIELPGESVGDRITSANESRSWDWYLEHYREDENTLRDELLEKLDLTSWIQAPIGIDSVQADGFLSIRRSEREPFSLTEIGMLGQFARLVTPIIQRVQVREHAVLLGREKAYSRQLDAQNNELARLAESRCEFLSTVSHELRTPLTTITSFGDILSHDRESTLSERQKQQIEAIRRATRDLTSIVDDLLDVSQSDGGHMALTKEPLDIRSLLEEVVEDASLGLQEKGQSLVLQNLDQSVQVSADRVRLVQVIGNLISNAGKYSDQNASIDVDVSRDTNHVTLSFTDRGIGISDKDVARITEPFFRSADPRIRRQRGSGLGLSVVRAIIESHGGELTFESQLNIGTTATLTLPAIH
ncbi:ATP-binding protein [Candidatus Lucifugimonas marina]|uniref:histidine kinase n=1 Tax=Candidatus Lucifugimonas marina TaxID=3038979 RepID=A0AAJ6CV04_9CHLR|nr:hypothetical protein [SAR202 cluster bacterium JH702]MDG0870912.1 hypothetical protein [SAR202 cluster bacterium JH639]WFG35854.1 hypothetical protein GKN94_09150 [SAR202 cluster bacterium JH545]WFG39799.1 hypothetical protein GKO48_09260 [SAR202 cluster bacterium JH1073]